MTSDQYKDLSMWEALAVVQREAPVIRKTETANIEGNKPFSYNFAGYVTVWEQVATLMDDLGFVWSCLPTLEDLGGGQTRFIAEYTLFHLPSGQSRSGKYPVVGETPQQRGGGVTYARRYALVAVLNLRVAEDDDDAVAAENRASASPSELAKGARQPRQTAQRRPARPRAAPPPTQGGQPPVAANPDGPASEPTRKKMFASMGELGHSTREEYGEYINRVLVKHGAQPVSSSTELTQEQAGWVIEAAEAALAGPPVEEAGEPPAESEG